MNVEMLKTELYKIFSRKAVWLALVVFLALFSLLQMQFRDTVGIQYTLKPVRAALETAAGREELRAFVRGKGYACGADDLMPFLPQEVRDYIEQYRDSERVYRTLRGYLAHALNNFFERTDARAAYIEGLAEYTDAPGQQKARAKLPRAYRETPVEIGLNVEPGATALIDVNHAAVFPGMIMLVILVGLSGVYADEYTSGTQAALLTARKGRLGVFFAKLLASGIFVAVVVTCMEGAALLVCAVCYRGPDVSLSAASTYGLSLTLYGGTVGGFCLRQAAGTLLAGWTLGSVVLCLSAYSKNALIPFFAAGIFYGGTALYAHTIPFPPHLSAVWSLPGELSLFMLQTQVELVAAGRYTNVFGLLVPTLTLNVLCNVLLAALCLTLCCRAYIRKQVKD